MTPKKTHGLNTSEQKKLIGTYSRNIDTSNDQIWVIFTPENHPKEGFFIFNRIAFDKVFQEIIETYDIFDPKGFTKEFCGFARDVVQKEWMCIRKYKTYSSSIIIHHSGFLLYHYSLCEKPDDSFKKLLTLTGILIREIIPVLYKAMNYSKNVMINIFWQAKEIEVMNYHDKQEIHQLKVDIMDPLSINQAIEQTKKIFRSIINRTYH